MPLPLGYTLIVTLSVPLVPKLELDRAVKGLKEAEEKLEQSETEQIQLQDYLDQANERIEELEALVALGKKKPADSEISLLLRLEEEVRKAEHPMTHHRYDPDQLQWILDMLVSTRCTDPQPKKESDPGSGPGPKKAEPVDLHAKPLALKLCVDEDDPQVKLKTP